VKSKPSFPNQVDLLQSAKLLYGEIKPTYFGGYKNPIGIEVEVENVTQSYQKIPFYWSSTQDNSLKVKGTELISSPIGGHNIDYAIHELERTLKEIAPNALWSHRTSIHVHCNISDLSRAKLELLIAYYALLEPLYFSFVAPHRHGNSFCYPLVDVLPANARKYIGDANIKYCALNIGAVGTHSTVEFRHLEGTGDMTKIRRWIQLVVKLYDFIESNPIPQLNSRFKGLGTKKDYSELVQDIFGKTSVLFNNLDHRGMMYQNYKWSSLFLRGK
jgi:hypothetical protein